MTKPPKLDRKQLKQPDTFTQRGLSAMTWLVGHQSRFVPVVVLAALLIAGGYGYDWYHAHQLDKSWCAYHEAMKLPEPRRWEELKGVAGQHPNNRATFFAAIQVADHAYSEAKNALIKNDPTGTAPLPVPVDDNASLSIEWYTKALGFSELLPAEKQLIYINRGQAQELRRKYDQALSDYRAAADFGGEAKAFALLNVGRALELKKETAKAVETYEKVTVDFANTEYAKEAKNSVRRLKSPLFSTNAE